MSNVALSHNQNILEQIYIAKDNNNYKSFDNIRPITKTSPIYKLLDTILDLRLKEELNKNGQFLLDRSQTGFREGLGCEVNILRLIESLRNMRDNKKDKKKKLWSLYIDEKSAFDSVNHIILFEKLEKLGISENLRNTIQ